jgi:hypothetical protein
VNDGSVGVTERQVGEPSIEVVTWSVFGIDALRFCLSKVTGCARVVRMMVSLHATAERALAARQQKQRYK